MMPGLYDGAVLEYPDHRRVETDCAVRTKFLQIEDMSYGTRVGRPCASVVVVV